MFALEWCEFCWSVREVLSAYGIEYTSVDLDSTDFQTDNQGGKLRVALRQKAGWSTFPQIYKKGEFLGGCTDLFEGLKAGAIQKHLAEQGIDFKKEMDQDHYGFLPGWLHPR